MAYYALEQLDTFRVYLLFYFKTISKQYRVLIRNSLLFSVADLEDWLDNAYFDYQVLCHNNATYESNC